MRKLFKRKGFLIDKISEDSFYENLLLGFPSFLKTCPFVSHVQVKRSPAATVEEVNQWETTNSLQLPEDLRNFFLSTNGFSFTYKFQYDKGDGEEINHIIGGVQINSLLNVEKMNFTEVVHIIEGDLRILPAFNRVYPLAKLDESNCVLLAQFNLSKPPTIWLYYNKAFYFLCKDFATYFRMALAHVGVPGWQLTLLNATLPEWSMEMLQIVAPGILNNQHRQLCESMCQQNEIDCEIFDIQYDLGLTSESKKKKSIGRSKPKK